MLLNPITVHWKCFFFIIKQNLLKALTLMPKQREENTWVVHSKYNTYCGWNKVFLSFLFTSLCSPFILVPLLDPYNFVSRNLIEQWRSGCPGNHWEQVALVKIAHPVCAKAASFPLLFNLLLSIVISLVRQRGEHCGWSVKGIRSVHLAPGKVRHLEEWFGLLHADYTVTLLIHWVRRAVTERDTYMM